MSLSTPKKITVFLTALAASLCLATTPALARGHGGGAPHMQNFGFGGGSHHSATMPRFSGSSPFRSSPGVGNVRPVPGQQGNRSFFGGPQSSQRSNVSPSRVSPRTPGQVTPRDGYPNQVRQSPPPPPAPRDYAGGGYGYAPEPPVQQGVDPLEVISEVLSIVNGITGY